MNNIGKYPVEKREDKLWASRFVTYLSHLSNEIDLRLQKSLLREMSLMIENYFGDLKMIDSSRYRALYIS